MEVDEKLDVPTETNIEKPNNDSVLEVKTEENPENVPQKPKAPKPKKRKKPKDATAPRQPLTGYVRFLNERRETVRSENPNLTFADITKMLASEWGSLPADKKQQYLDEAEKDRERYTIEYNEYKKTDAYKSFVEQQKEKKSKDHFKEDCKLQSLNSSQPLLNKDPQDMEFGNFDIPIFTEEFLDHNKTRDSELRQLRKINTDYEQQNAILQKHIENMKDAISKLEVEINHQTKSNTALQRHLDHLRNTLTSGFGGVKLPGIKEVATLNNINSYMVNLHSILLENSSHDTNLLQTVRDIVSKLEFNG